MLPGPEIKPAKLSGKKGSRRNRTGKSLAEVADRHVCYEASVQCVEAEIDFPDEDVPDAPAQRAAPVLSVLEADLEVALADGQRGERIRDGYRIVLIGETNAGKSSLFNALVEREAAIVTPIAGTTRDVPGVPRNLYLIPGCPSRGCPAASEKDV